MGVVGLEYSAKRGGGVPTRIGGLRVRWGRIKRRLKHAFPYSVGIHKTYTNATRKRYIVEKFDLSCIYNAVVAATNAEETFDILTAEMLNWHAAGEYPARHEVIAEFILAGRTEGTAKVYASRLLKWARSGKTPRSMHAAVTSDPPGAAKGKGGRPKGKPETKADAAKADAAKADAASVPNADVSWKQFLETLRAQAPGRKDWQSEDIVAFQDCASKMIALIARNAK